VAIKPNLTESLAMAGSAQDFQPRSALIVVSDAAEGNRFKDFVKPPSRVLVTAVANRTTQAAADKELANAIFQWMRETF
jgi:hypothetical protein